MNTTPPRTAFAQVCPPAPRKIAPKRMRLDDPLPPVCHILEDPPMPMTNVLVGEVLRLLEQRWGFAQMMGLITSQLTGTRGVEALRTCMRYMEERARSQQRLQDDFMRLLQAEAKVNETV
jgi:hypothetical protein